MPTGHYDRSRAKQRREWREKKMAEAAANAPITLEGLREQSLGALYAERDGIERQIQELTEIAFNLNRYLEQIMTAIDTLQPTSDVTS